MLKLPRSVLFFLLYKKIHYTSMYMCVHRVEVADKLPWNLIFVEFHLLWLPSA